MFFVFFRFACLFVSLVFVIVYLIPSAFVVSFQFTFDLIKFVQLYIKFLFWKLLTTTTTKQNCFIVSRKRRTFTVSEMLCNNNKIKLPMK